MHWTRNGRKLQLLALAIGLATLATSGWVALAQESGAL
jgi:hypothetical protein